MNISELNKIMEQAKREVESGKQPANVSEGICKAHGLSWMFIAPLVLGFKK